MLVTVVHDDDFRIHFFYGITAGHIAVLADDHRDTRHHLGHQVRFVTGFIAGHIDLFSVGDHAQRLIPVGTVSAVQDHHAVSHIPDDHGDPLRGRSLAGTANSNVTDGDNAAIQLASGQKTGLIHPQVDPGAKAVHIGQAPQQT